MAKIVSFGEILLRFTPAQLHERVFTAITFQRAYAGAESNVAIDLSILGHQVQYVTCLPDNPLGDGAVNSLREHGVDTRFIIRSGKRIGTYYIEHGASIRPTRVTYDREGSAIAMIRPGQFHWDEIFTGKDWYVLTGITPALSAACAEESLTALKKAKANGVQVAFDLNFRRTLWSREEARKVLTPMMPYIDVLFANAGSAYDVFDIETEQSEDWETLLASTRQAAKALGKIGDFKLIALTTREQDSATENGWAGMLYDGNTFYESKKYRFQVVDRLGGGDAFFAGVLHGITHGWSLAATVEFGTAASALKHTLPGDLNIVSEQEILEVAEGNISGRVKR
jgi:2-dehydro-3-deoxygluconokinase